MKVCCVPGLIAFNVVKEGLRKKEIEIKSHQLDREKLLEWMKLEYETSTALWSLPMTIGSFIAFSWVATTHIDLFHSWHVHNALLERFPTLAVIIKRKYVDIPTLNQWTRQHFLPTVFRQDPIYDPVPGRLADQNQMITGVRFAKSYYEPSPCPTNEVLSRIFNSRTGECYFAGELKTDYIVFPYQLEQSLLLEQFETLVRMPWLDEAVRMLEYQVFLYNANVNLFTLEITQFEFESNGLMKHRQHYESFSAEPYFSVTNLIPDVLFILLTLRVAYTNVKEMIPAIMAGLDGFMNYLTFWKVLEWISIFFSSFCFGLWITVYFKITVDLPEALATLPKGAFDQALQQKGSLTGTSLAYLNFDELQAIMSLEDIEERLNVIMTVGNSIRDDSELMRNLFALNFMVIIFRFFKSFQANPWLDVVVQTLVHCTPNVAHFFLVFSAIFTCYAFAGHFLLGNVLKGVEAQASRCPA
ncbi:PKD2 [Symbiodinium natans]|uniref:PKD2 protein n=1 Tax=Symbiodinium natans TaxID=878477 RepID=A0A812SAA6_9DINO|nr:PKD2 [Symbiodinium natans]